MNHPIHQLGEVEVHSLYLDEVLGAILHSIIFCRILHSPTPTIPIPTRPIPPTRPTIPTTTSSNTGTGIGTGTGTGTGTGSIMTKNSTETDEEEQRRRRRRQQQQYEEEEDEDEDDDILDDDVDLFLPFSQQRNPRQRQGLGLGQRQGLGLGQRLRQEGLEREGEEGNVNEDERQEGPNNHQKEKNGVAETTETTIGTTDVLKDLSNDSSSSWEKTDLELDLDLDSDLKAVNPTSQDRPKSCIVPIDVYCPRLSLSYPKVGVYYYERQRIGPFEGDKQQRRRSDDLGEDHRDRNRTEQQQLQLQQQLPKHINGPVQAPSDGDRRSSCGSSTGSGGESDGHLPFQWVKGKRVMEGLDESIDFAIGRCISSLSDVGPELKRGKIKISFYQKRTVKKLFFESKENIIREEWEIPLLVEMIPPPIGTDISSEREQRMYQKKAQDCLKSTLREIYQKIEGPIETNLPYEFAFSFGDDREQNQDSFLALVTDNPVMGVFKNR